MIFVKETRPRIVVDNPTLGALVIMKKVGELWQTLLAKEDGTTYFKDKARADKLRYLKEQKEFYDEVERIRSAEVKPEEKVPQEQSLKNQEDEEEQEQSEGSANGTNPLQTIPDFTVQLDPHSAQLPEEAAVEGEDQDLNLQKPKKPLTAFGLYCQELKDQAKKDAKEIRKQAKKTNSTEGIQNIQTMKQIQKTASSEWTLLGQRNKKLYEERAQIAKDQYASEMKCYEDLYQKRQSERKAPHEPIKQQAKVMLDFTKKRDQKEFDKQSRETENDLEIKIEEEEGLEVAQGEVQELDQQPMKKQQKTEDNSKSTMSNMFQKGQNGQQIAK